MTQPAKASSPAQVLSSNDEQSSSKASSLAKKSASKVKPIPNASPASISDKQANHPQDLVVPADSDRPATQIVRTLAVDIGGSGVKAMLLDAQGIALGDRDRIKTPKPATPDAVIGVIESLAQRQSAQFDRISVGFPGVVSKGVIRTAVNLHSDWEGVNLADELTQRLSVPTRVANDADIQGLGAISGQGVELVVTLGTGFGTALFTDGRLVPNLEIAHHRFRKGQTYEEQLGRAALKKAGHKTWNARLLKAIHSLSKAFNYDRLYIGGGEVKEIRVDLPKNVSVISNMLGLLGGIHLWRDE